MHSYLLLAVSLSVFSTLHALDNGLGKTPPMGWLSWERFRCNMDCDNFPDECISERLIRGIADAMVAEGYKDVGYEYVTIDDCWLSRERDAQGRLEADSARFPSGIKNLSDYVHSKGLKFGIYNAIGTNTCAGYPGLHGHLETDANTFAEWGVDYLKIDGCNLDPNEYDKEYPEFGKYLKATNRSIFYNCEWANYQHHYGIKTDYEALAATCNSFRNWDDIDDSWYSVMSVIEFIGQNQDDFQSYAGPGHWNDPDMLVIGNYGLTIDQAKSQMSIWAILAAPLLMSNDLRSTRPEFKAILQNKNVIAVDQDALGVGGRMVHEVDDFEFWTKPVLPLSSNNETSFAVAALSKRVDGAPHSVTVDLSTLGLANSYSFTELFDAVPDFQIGTGGSLTVRVNPSGVLLFKAEVK